jgi:hypothetical protein
MSSNGIKPQKEILRIFFKSKTSLFSCLQWFRSPTNWKMDRIRVRLLQKFVDLKGGKHLEWFNLIFAIEGLEVSQVGK